MKLATEYPEEIRKYCKELGIELGEEESILTTTCNCLTFMTLDREEKDVEELPWACLLRNRT